MEMLMVTIVYHWICVPIIIVICFVLIVNRLEPTTCAEVCHMSILVEIFYLM